MRGGILIIGSLLWDNRQRDAWRRSRLHVDGKVHVKAPIRYGRRSKSWGKTFTMTLGTDDALGKAVLIPCASPIGGVTCLVAEAEVLWKAEHSAAAPNSISASCGCVGVLFDPDTPRANWSEGWASYFRSNARPVPPVDDTGMLRIAWPVAIAEGRPADVDVVLATATKAEANRPTATEIADAWVDQNNGHERYFFENVRHGIRTPDDVLIWKRIEERTPRWLRGEMYAEAIALLRTEAA